MSRRRGLLAGTFDKTARWSESLDQRGSISTQGLLMASFRWWRHLVQEQWSAAALLQAKFKQRQVAMSCSMLQEAAYGSWTLRRFTR